MTNYNAMFAQLMGLVGQNALAQPVAEKFNPLAKTLNPSAGLEGARMASGGGGPRPSMRMDLARLRSQAEANKRATGNVWGEAEMSLPSGAGLRVVVNPRSGNSRGANRGSHLTQQYVYREPGGEWKAITAKQLKDILGE
jgi:hypothetical protein